MIVSSAADLQEGAWAAIGEPGLLQEKLKTSGSPTPLTLAAGEFVRVCDDCLTMFVRPTWVNA